MAETYKLLDQRALTNSPAALYTVASGFSYIKNIVCCNNDLAANKSITLFVVKPGGAADAGAGDRFLPARGAGVSRCGARCPRYRCQYLIRLF